MTGVRTPIVMDQDTKSSLEFKPNIAEQSEQDRGTSPRLQYGIKQEITRADTPRRKLSERLYVIDRSEDNMESHSLSGRGGAPAANTDSHQTNKKTILKVLLRSEMLKVYAIAQSQASKASHPSSWRVEAATTDTSRENIYKRTVLEELSERFDVIAQREDNWDGYESKSPNKSSLYHARQFMREFFDAIASEDPSRFTPLISSDEDGYITVAWHDEGRQLHLQIEEDEVDYIQVWGAEY